MNEVGFLPGVQYISCFGVVHWAKTQKCTQAEQTVQFVRSLFGSPIEKEESDLVVYQPTRKFDHEYSSIFSFIKFAVKKDFFKFPF